MDSEADPDPEWLQVKTTMMTKEFTDVNEGEKELMKLWNLHVMKYNYVADRQIPLACKRFVELHGREIIQKNLYRNFCLHLTNLFDFGLLTPQRMHSAIDMLHSQMRETNSSGSQQSWKSSQGNNNAKNGNEIKFPPNPLKSFNFSGANATSSTPQIKTGSAGLGTNTAISTQIGSGTTSTANSSTANNNSSCSSSEI